MLIEVADGVLVHRSTLLENNTVVVDSDDGVLLVDPGLTDAELVCLAGDLDARGRAVVAGFATHPDWDHVLWHERFGDVPRWGTAACAAFMRGFRSHPGWRDLAAQGLPPEIAGEVPLELYGDLTALPVGCRELPWNGPRVRVVEHPAHAPGHAALVVEGAGVLVAGDMLSDVLVPMLDETLTALADYTTGLDRLEQQAGGCTAVVPGHGSATDGAGLQARFALDRAYLDAVAAGRTPEDPRIGTGVRPGWEWVTDLHAWQAETVAAGGVR